jgi:hypothetical protein
VKHIKQFPHCDSRILHAPGECQYCDKYPGWQELRQMWHIAFTGKQPESLDEPRWTTKGPVLPCPADYIRGDKHAIWGGNRAYPPAHVRVPGERGRVFFSLPDQAIPQADGNATPPTRSIGCPLDTDGDGNCPRHPQGCAKADPLVACEWCKESFPESTMASYMTMKPFTKVKVVKFWCVDSVECALRAQRSAPVGG